MNETVSLDYPTCHKTSHSVHGAMSHQRTLSLPGPRLALAGVGRSPHKYLHFHYGSSSAIRSGKWKMYRRNGRSPWELYDLSNDIGETATRAAANWEVIHRLEEEHARWKSNAMALGDSG